MCIDVYLYTVHTQMCIPGYIHFTHMVIQKTVTVEKKGDFKGRQPLEYTLNIPLTLSENKMLYFCPNFLNFSVQEIAAPLQLTAF